VETQETKTLDRAGAINIRPDVVIYFGPRPVGILDAKYKLRSGGAPTASDAVQVLAYSRRYSIRRSWLVYPDQPVGEQVFVTHDKLNEIATYGLNLSSDWGDLEAGLDRLALRIEGQRSPA
ncbi:MAG TPA: hypothetical protein ENJ18_11825, partial [Nannocystis exedens]|nr:hypothetical protein [Nannocystis exedens]